MTIINDIDQLSAGEMDEYIEQLLAEMPEPVVNNILDEPISEAVKERPLLPRKYRPSPPPRKAKERKRKAIIEEFDPAPTSKPFRTIQDYQKEILEMFKEASKNGKLVFRKTPWAIGKFLRGWQMNVPQGHPLGADPKAFLDDVRPQIRKKLTEEVVALKGVKFQLALKISLRKDRPDGAEEYLDPVLRHKQEALMRAGEINEALDKALPRVLELLEKWTQRGSGWAVDRVETLWLDIARYQPLRGGSYIPLPAAVKNKKAVVNVKNEDDHCLRWALRSAMISPPKTMCRGPPSTPPKMGLTQPSRGLMPPHQSLRLRRWRGKETELLTYLDGTRVLLSTSSASSRMTCLELTYC